ncbi:alpha/beta hydrolase, partial [Burkholderia multivorans]
GMIALNPNARQVSISDSKHLPMNDHPQEFNQLIGEFFEEVVAL